MTDNEFKQNLLDEVNKLNESVSKYFGTEMSKPVVNSDIWDSKLGFYCDWQIKDNVNGYNLTQPLVVKINDWSRYPALSVLNGSFSGYDNGFFGKDCIVINNPYWWDGASFAPDGVMDKSQSWKVKLIQRLCKRVLPCSCIHDWLYGGLDGQLTEIYRKKQSDSKLTDHELFTLFRKDIDLLFGDLLVKYTNKPVAYIYYNAVRLAGGVFHTFNEKLSKINDSKITPIK